ncbi:MAG: rod-binding protein, partial [Bdellovibrionota bacterium]
ASLLLFFILFLTVAALGVPPGAWAMDVSNAQMRPPLPQPEVIDKNSPEYQAAKGFEIHFMQEMMRNMRKTVPEDPELANNQGYHVFRDMLDDHYAEQASRTQGIGLAEMIVKQLMERQAQSHPHQPVAVRDVNKSDVIKK